MKALRFQAFQVAGRYWRGENRRAGPFFLNTSGGTVLERVLKCLCLYEAAALWTRKVPTVTSLVYRCRRGPVSLFAASLVGVLSLLFALAWHLLWDGWDREA